jgi:tight adherence protein C
VVHLGPLLSMFVFLVVFLGAAGMGRSLLLWLYGDHRRALARLRDLGPAEKPAAERPKAVEMVLSALPAVGALVVPGDKQILERLKERLTQAGIYGPSAVLILLGTQVLLMVLLPLTTALLPFALGLLSGLHALVVAAVAVAVGMLTPSLWVDYQRRCRQAELRRALPDCLDMLVLCVEAGLSLNAALVRVASELQIAHPGLAREMNILLREAQLGLPVSEAMAKFGQRCGLEEVRELSAVLLQAERYGTSSVKALRLHAELCRQQRQQRAEERAQKAAVKIVFPTLLCIFPAIFIVILGPAAYQIADMLAKMR